MFAATLFLVFLDFQPSFAKTLYCNHEKLPTVLYINSYHPGYSWSDSLATGIRETLNGKVALYTEFLDAKRPDFEKYEGTLQNVFALKYGEMPIDAVLTSDDAAFQFVVKNRETLFKDVPVITCGINYMTSETLDKCPGSTGVMEGTHPNDTVQLALKLFPNTRQIIFISDYTINGRLEPWLENIEHMLPNGIDALEIHQERNTTMEDILAQVRTAATKPSIIVYFGLTIDDIRTGSEAILMEQLASIGPPVFVFDKRYIPYGALGGIVQNGREQGAQAARMLLELLGGKPIETIAPVYQSIDERIFNYSKLKYFGLADSPLIEDATILGAPDARINRYRLFLIIGAVFIAVQTALITGLIHLSRLRNRTALELKEAKETAEVASKAKSEFLMMVSHEFRTPLNAIWGFAELLTEETDPDARTEYINHIKDSGNCLLGIVNDILEYTNANRATGRTVTQACCLADHLAALVGEHLPNAQKKGLELEFHSFFPNSPSLCVHWPYLKLAVCKLLENSIKFSKTGHIQVVLDEYLAPGERSITVSVIDQGPGFDEEQTENMMEIFSQAEDYMTREHTGLGLGLALCYRMVTTIGGTLECSSKPHEETIFRILLPE